MTNLEEIKSEIDELKKYREVIFKLKENSFTENKEETKKDKPKVKRLEVRKNEHIWRVRGVIN